MKYIMFGFFRVRGFVWCCLVLVSWLIGSTVMLSQESVDSLEQAEASVKPGITSRFWIPS